MANQEKDILCQATLHQEIVRWGRQTFQMSSSLTKNHVLFDYLPILETVPNHNSIRLGRHLFCSKVEFQDRKIHWCSI